MVSRIQESSMLHMLILLLMREYLRNLSMIVSTRCFHCVKQQSSSVVLCILLLIVLLCYDYSRVSGLFVSLSVCLLQVVIAFSSLYVNGISLYLRVLWMAISLCLGCKFSFDVISSTCFRHWWNYILYGGLFCLQHNIQFCYVTCWWYECKKLVTCPFMVNVWQVKLNQDSGLSITPVCQIYY